MSSTNVYDKMNSFASDRKPSMCVFIGKSRPFLPHDTGKVLLQELSKQGFTLEGVFFYPNDPLREWAKDHFPVYLVPKFLRGSYGLMAKNLREQGPDEKFQQWLTWFNNRQFTQGLVFFAGWIPPHIFSIFPQGMINYHPGPLPELPGYEPETMAVLLGLDRFHGTMHVVDEIFDNGELLWYSPSIKIKPTDGPVSILYKTTIKACKTMPQALDLFYRGSLTKPKLSGRSVVVYASRKACRNFSVIDWQRDGLETILRKNRAFNEQEISLDLLCHAFGAITTVKDAVSAENIFRKLFIKRMKLGNKKPLPGSQIGVYNGPGRFKGSPVFKTLTGNILLLCESRDESVLVKHARRVRLYQSKPAQQLEKIL
jgi:folate-dependent phosphoribosylglycinamide formyltransferase PurN